MIKIFVYAADQSLAEQTVQRLKEAGADQVEVLAELKIPGRPPKEHRYLFICETPAEKLADLMPQVLEEAAYATELSTWYEAQLKILDVYTAHKKRSILLTTSQLQANPQALVEHINAQWQLQLTQPEGGLTHNDGKETDSLIGYLVQNLIEKTPPLQQLAASQTQATGCAEQSYGESEAIDSYRKIKAAKSAFKHQIDDAQKRLSDFQNLQEESELLLLQLHQAQEESELLLLQLHQVQEELENYFLKNQETEAKHAKQQARWTRLLEKHPDYIETESVRVEVLDPKTQTLKWVVHGLEGQGIAKDCLEFESFIESGVLGIRFNKTNSRNEPTLKNWPSSCEGESVDCIPAGKGNVMRLRAMTLRGLSASDWKLLNTLPQLIKQHLNDTALDAKHFAAVTDGANKLTLGINALPKTLRYDAATLKSNKVNPDYEHLWFELHNASYDTYYWPKFEFRLGAANIKPGKFSAHPKLEIPLIDGKIKPFDSWFGESYDEYGDKYELRFDLISGVADIATLLRLNKIDQQVVSTLVKSLAAIIAEVNNQEPKIKRPNDEWFNLSNHLINLI